MFDLHQTMSNCQGLSRRAFLRVGSLPLFGLTLAQALEARAAQQGGRDISCILLWTNGGMSNIDTFDMKPEAPVEFRGQFKSIATKIPGVQVCEHLPRMADQIDRLCL